MKPRNVTFSLLLIIAILAFAIIKKWQEPKREELFKRKQSHLIYTAYALCRMDCFDISREDVSFIIQKGIILLNKSNRRSQPCPIYALQGRTAKGRYIRVLFEQCLNSTRVIGCYDLEKETPCNCPVL